MFSVPLAHNLKHTNKRQSETQNYLNSVIKIKNIKFLDAAAKQISHSCPIMHFFCEHIEHRISGEVQKFATQKVESPTSLL